MCQCVKGVEKKEQKERKQEIVIAKYEQNPFLYDKENPAFKDARKRQEVIWEISQIVEWTPREVLNTWRNLRDRYKKEKRLNDMCKSGSAAGKPGKTWRFLANFQFLETHLRKRSSLCITSAEEDPDSPESTMFVDPSGVLMNLACASDRFAMEQMRAIDDEIFGNDAGSSSGNASCVSNTSKETESRSLLEGPSEVDASKISQPLTPHLPTLSPQGKKRTHSARSRAKTDAEINADIKRTLSSLQSTCQASKEKNSCTVIGESLGQALNEIKDVVKQNLWKRRIRSIISDIEEGLTPDESY